MQLKTAQIEPPGEFFRGIWRVMVPEVAHRLGCALGKDIVRLLDYDISRLSLTGLDYGIRNLFWFSELAWGNLPSLLDAYGRSSNYRHGASFPTLERAPIVEATIEIRTRAEVPWVEPKLLEQLKERLADYPSILSQRAFGQEFQFGPNQPTQSTYQDLGFKGFRLQSANGLHVAQFNRDGFIFSRLQPYEGWSKFSGEMLRLWAIYTEIAVPTEVQRLGSRSINRIVFPPDRVLLEDYLKAPPQMSADLNFPFVSFFHQDTFAIPGHPYFVNVIQTVQQQQDVAGEGDALLLDIDVFMERPFTCQIDALVHRIAQMRWLKNKVFFGTITEVAMERFK